MILTGGITDWRKLSELAYPLPEAIGIALGKSSGLTKIFTSIGLFGLIASVHGTILASSRQVFAMARNGYLPRKLSVINHRFKTPHWALIAGGAVSFIALWMGTIDEIIVISAMGAVLMYMMSMISLFVLRRKEPTLERPFASPFYPYFPAIALLLSAVSLIAFIYYYPMLGLIFFGGLGAVIILFMSMGKHKVRIMDDALLEKSVVIIPAE